MMSVPDLPDLDALAGAVGVPGFVLTRYVFQADRYYRTFRLRKRSGRGYRQIAAPSRELKGLQRWVAAVILRERDLPDNCTAFRRGSSITANARPHANRGFVFNADVKDLYPSITLARVIGLFEAMGYPPLVAFALGKLTTYKRRLPQGAPSSPHIANLICRKLDRRLAGYCQAAGWTYTRYCDDITISGPGRMGGGPSKVREIVESCGFRLNHRKTRVMRRNSRQTVTGLVVNTEVNLPRERRKAWRALFHQAKTDPGAFRHRAAELEGYAAFLHMVRPDDPALPRYRRTVAALKASPPHT